MSRERSPGPQISRRNMLAALGLAGAAAASVPILSSCGVGGRTSAPNGAADVTGGFDWKRASGTTINVLQTPHPYQRSYQPLIAEFTELTGINVNVDLVPEADYFTKLNTELAGGTGKHDAFMTRRVLHLAVRSGRLDRRPRTRGWATPRPPRRTTTSRTSSKDCAPPPGGISPPGSPWAPVGNGRSRGGSRTTSSPTTRPTSTSAASRNCPTGSTTSSSWPSI